MTEAKAMKGDRKAKVLAISVLHPLHMWAGTKTVRSVSAWLSRHSRSALASKLSIGSTTRLSAGPMRLKSAPASPPLDRLESNGVRTVVVEDASRFARDLVAQELGLLLLIKRDVRVASGDDSVT